MKLHSHGDLLCRRISPATCVAAAALNQRLPAACVQKRKKINSRENCVLSLIHENAQNRNALSKPTWTTLKSWRGQDKGSLAVRRQRVSLCDSIAPPLRPPILPLHVERPSASERRYGVWVSSRAHYVF